MKGKHVLLTTFIYIYISMICRQLRTSVYIPKVYADRYLYVYVQKIHSLYVYIRYVFFTFLFTIISLCPLVGYVPGRDAIW